MGDIRWEIGDELPSALADGLRRINNLGFNPKFGAKAQDYNRLPQPSLKRDGNSSGLWYPDFFFLIPPSSFLLPPSSFLLPHSSFLLPHSSFFLSACPLVRWLSQSVGGFHQRFVFPDKAVSQDQENQRDQREKNTCLVGWFI